MSENCNCSCCEESDEAEEKETGYKMVGGFTDPLSFEARFKVGKMERSVGEILEEGAETYETKNDDYGDSWRKTGEMIWEMTDGEEIVLSSAKDVIRFGLYTRRMDKIQRGFNGEFMSDVMEHESIQDSHEDEMVYAGMHSKTHE